MRVEELPAGVAPPGQKTPATFTPRRGTTVQAVPQARRVLPVLANLKPNYVPPAVHAAMMRGQVPAMVNAVKIPGQPPMQGGILGSGGRLTFNPAALGKGGGLDGLGTASAVDGRECPATGSWETYCDCMFENGSPNWKTCRSSWPFAPWTIVGKLIGGGGGAGGVVKTGQEIVNTGTGGGAPAPVKTADGKWPWEATAPATPAPSNTATYAIAAVGALALGGIGYLALRRRRPAPAAMGSFSRRYRKSRRGKR